MADGLRTALMAALPATTARRPGATRPGSGTGTTSDPDADRGMNAQSNVRTVGVNHHTTGTFNPYTGTYSGYTTSTPITAGSHDADVVAVMFRAGDPEAANAIDARTASAAECQIPR